MAFDNNVVLVGNVTRDPELRFTQGGAAVCSFGLLGTNDLNKAKTKPIFLISRVGATSQKMWLSP